MILKWELFTSRQFGQFKRVVVGFAMSCFVGPLAGFEWYIAARNHPCVNLDIQNSL